VPAPPADAGDTSTAAVEGLRLRLDESEAKLAEIRKLLAEPTP
jgi:voltage-gated potassium channel